jgi:uncharacterized protein YeaO (DUF488 family)
MAGLALKRAYEAAAPDDGARILVERLWPRGVSKEKAALSLWLKDIAPSDGLRRWYSHDIARWPEFRRRYTAELNNNAAALTLLRQRMAQGRITLIYAARDTEHNSAAVLRDYLENNTAP